MKLFKQLPMPYFLWVAWLRFFHIFFLALFSLGGMVALFSTYFFGKSRQLHIHFFFHLNHVIFISKKKVFFWWCVFCSRKFFFPVLFWPDFFLQLPLFENFLMLNLKTEIRPRSIHLVFFPWSLFSTTIKKSNRLQ